MSLIRKDNRAVALVTVLVFLMLSVLLSAALFALMTNEARLIEHQIRRIKAMYAAEAGVIDARWQLWNGIDPFPYSFDLTDFGLSGKVVDINRVAGSGPLATDEINAQVDYKVF